MVVKNTGKDCWRPCGKQQGACDWCGAGVCCRSGWWDRRNGCDGTIGGARRHECVDGKTEFYSKHNLLDNLIYDKI